MKRYSEAAWEQAMKVQEVILRAMAKRITCLAGGASVVRGFPFSRAGTVLAHDLDRAGPPLSRVEGTGNGRGAGVSLRMAGTRLGALLGQGWRARPRNGRP